jgi:hypothetical protein
MAVAFCAVLAAGPKAEAAFSPVKQAKRQVAASHERILEQVYGGNFVADSSGLSFSNGSGVTVTRLDDDTEPQWVGHGVSAGAVAAFSGKARSARYFGSATNANPLLRVSGRGFEVQGEGSSSELGSELLLTTGRNHKARTFSSVADSNSDGMDHLVAYEVKGRAQQASVYLLCWEDRFARRSDRDYNDLVIELRSTEAAAAQAPLSQPLLIPLPPAAWPGLAGLLAVAWGSGRRKRSA